MEHKKGQTSTIILVIAFFVILLLAIFWAFPNYIVYAKELNGKADLKEAEWNRQIAIEEAKAEKESAQLKADAEVIRAHGIAEANVIIGHSITENSLKYRFIEGLHDGSSEIIYVPTEANLPILEAGRF